MPEAVLAVVGPRDDPEERNLEAIVERHARFVLGSAKAAARASTFGTGSRARRSWLCAWLRPLRVAAAAETEPIVARWQVMGPEAAFIGPAGVVAIAFLLFGGHFGERNAGRPLLHVFEKLLHFGPR